MLACWVSGAQQKKKVPGSGNGRDSRAGPGRLGYASVANWVSREGMWKDLGEGTVGLEVGLGFMGGNFTI